MTLNNNMYHINVESLLWLPGQLGVFWKNCEGHYLGCNDVAAEKAGLQSRQDVVGRTDFDIDALSNEEATKIRDGDKQTIQEKKPFYFLYTATQSNSKNVFITFKAPLWNQDKKIVGTYGIDTFIDLNDQKSSHKKILLQAGIPVKELDAIKSRIFNQNQSVLSSKLTQRQIDCLYHLVKGMTVKEIALTLEISAKTVEHYLDIVKTKLNCRSRSQLVSKALEIPYIKNKLLTILNLSK
jgi:DNA-binding CsgD family transcriptional regulator